MNYSGLIKSITGDTLRLQENVPFVAADVARKEIKGLADPRVLGDCRVLYRAYPQIRGSVTREFGTITLPPGDPKHHP